MMRSQLVGPVLARVRAEGSDPRALIRRFALPASAERDGEVMLPLDKLHALLDAAELAARVRSRAEREGAGARGDGAADRDRRSGAAGAARRAGAGGARAARVAVALPRSGAAERARSPARRRARPGLDRARSRSRRVRC